MRTSLLNFIQDDCPGASEINLKDIGKNIWGPF